MSEYHEKQIRSSVTFLKRWAGANCYVWELKKSHQSLRLVLMRDQGPSNLMIALIQPTYIQCPISWPDAQLTIEYINCANDRHIRLRDKNLGYEIKAGGFEIFENVKL